MKNTIEEKKLNIKEIKKLQQENELLKSKVTEFENNWKRALADYQNLQKRNIEDRQNLISYANQTLILKLLLVVDSLEMLEKHSEDQGLKLILKEFKTILREEGLEELEFDKHSFDEKTMDAIELVDGEEGKVIEIVQKGYKIKEKIIRPAKVKVGHKGGNTNES